MDDVFPGGLTEDGSRARSAIASLVTTVTLATAFGLLALGWDYFWIVFPVGFGGVLPAALALATWYGSDADHEAKTETEDALDALKQQYVRGDIDEAEFERRVERLLETDSVDDVRESYAGDDHSEHSGRSDTRVDRPVGERE